MPLGSKNQHLSIMMMIILGFYHEAAILLSPEALETILLLP